MPSTRTGRPIGLLALTSLALALSSAPALASESPAPTLYSPSTSARSSAHLRVRYSLPEGAESKSLKMTFESGVETNEVVLADTVATAGEHELTLNVKNLMGSTLVANSTHNSVADGSYTVKLAYEAVGATSPNSITAEHVAIDTVTQPPILLKPEAAVTIGGAFPVEYSLPEEAAPGTVTLTFIGAGGTSVLVLPVNKVGINSVTLNPVDLAVGGSLLSGPEALAGGEYTLVLGYQDALMNPLATSASVKFTFSHPTPAPALLAPGASSLSPALLHVRYDLPEEALPGSLTLKFEGSSTS